MNRRYQPPQPTDSLLGRFGFGEGFDHYPRFCPLIPVDEHSCDRDVDHGEVVLEFFLVAGRDSSSFLDVNFYAIPIKGQSLVPRQL